MKCAWQAYLNIIPPWMRDEVDRIGRESLQELRMRIHQQPVLVTGTGVCSLEKRTSCEDIAYSINAISNYSPWAATTICSGYITAIGGHRMGICGDVAVVNGKINTIKNVTSICIRVSREFPGIGEKAAQADGSILIIGAPGRGKTTLLRDIIRCKSRLGAVAVVDERRELFPVSNGEFCFDTGCATDVLSGCNKRIGMQMLIRTMNPRWIAVDEITDEEDCRGLIQAAWCGVGLLATAHAENIDDFLNRPVYKQLVTNRIFQNVIVMHKDKSWTLERISI